MKYFAAHDIIYTMPCPHLHIPRRSENFVTCAMRQIHESLYNDHRIHCAECVSMFHPKSARDRCVYIALAELGFKSPKTGVNGYHAWRITQCCRLIVVENKPWIRVPDTQKWPQQLFFECFVNHRPRLGGEVRSKTVQLEGA